MVTLIDPETGQPLFSSNSIYGIYDIILMNWGKMFDFKLIDNSNGQIQIFDKLYTIQVTPYASNERSNFNE